jgi:adenine-specific DNA-methyltransferase
MNTLNYIGSKHTLLGRVADIITTNVPDASEKTFMDLFAGTGTVAFNMLDRFKSVSANDLEHYSYIINFALLKGHYSKRLKTILSDMNALTPVEGLIYQNYSPGPSCERMFFTSENAKKADAMRQHIDLLFHQGDIDENEKMFLLASLIVCIDKVANTASVYGAYLKHFKAAALKPLVLVPIHQRLAPDGLSSGLVKRKKKKTTTHVASENAVFQQKAEDLVVSDAADWDVVYLDPPYNNRQYGANYAPLNYIAAYNDVQLTGKTGLIPDYNKSVFCTKTSVEKAFRQLIRSLRCQYIFMSYNNEGLLSVDTLRAILQEKGNVTLYRIKYKKYRSSKTPTMTDSVIEYLWFCQVMTFPTSVQGSFEETTVESL